MQKSYYLGFMSYCSHDPAAALVQIQKHSESITCKFIHFEEGMLSRKKKSYHFPSRSIAACLNYFNIGISDLSKVVTDYMDNESFINTSYNYRHLVGDFIRNNLNLRSDQISKNIDHHYAHAMAAWVGSGYEDCAFLSIDGLGSLQSTHTIFITEGGKLQKVFTQTTPGIGALYSLVTELIGFKIGEEGKTMGLAPYGRELFESNRFPYIDFGGVYSSLSVDYSNIINRSPNKFLLTDFQFNNFEKIDLYNDYRTFLAFSIQQELEKCLVHLAIEIKKVTGKSKLCLSGGVALNCVVNEIIADTKIFEEVYVFPDSADSGLAVGLAFSAVHENLTESEWSMFLGSYKHPKFAPNNAVSKNKSRSLELLPWENLDLDAVVTELEKNSVIGIFWEGYEYGPRALGHRSFIASASNPKMKEILNTKIKHREPYRPFAPICLLEDFDTFFESSHANHEYMQYAVKTKDISLEKISSVVHYDKTARVQVATEDCGIIYNLLIRYKERNGFGVFINTSFNDNDEPIVLDELDAVSCFLRTNCDLLISNGKILRRSSIQKNIMNYSKLLDKELQIRNVERFQNSLKKILRPKTLSLKQYLYNYNVISEFNKKFESFIRLHRLILKIRKGERTKLQRLVISSRELNNFRNFMDLFYFNFRDFSEEFVEISDSVESIKFLLPGDFILSYNLSNILRDYDALGIVDKSKYEIFYDSNDFPISTFLDFGQDSIHTVNELTNTYENLNTLDIDSAFKNITS